MNFTEVLDEYVRARCSLVVVRTIEEPRVVRILQELGSARSRPVFSWDMGHGFKEIHRTGESEPPAAAKDAHAALDSIEKYGTDAVFALMDFHHSWENKQILRRLRSVAHSLVYQRKSIVVVGPVRELPVELGDEAVVLDLPPPTKDHLRELLDQLIRETAGLEVDLDAAGRERLLDAAKGLSLSQARRVLSLAIVRDGRLDADDIALVAAQKQVMVGTSDGLQIVTSTIGPSDVGGLGGLKSWIAQRGRSLSTPAREFGLPAPKGIALIGIPGTGKSISAKMIAGAWQQPLLRLDLGAVYGSYVGESESRLRRALATAEAMAPCVLWIDEIEKGLAYGSGRQDSGTGARVFGTVLTWMQERTAPCFVVATANDIASLPPELLRRGRFDEVFFLDLPDAAARRAILEVHLRTRRRDPARFDLDRIVEACEGFVGAEIEQLVVDALHHAFEESHDLADRHLLDAARELVPLADSQRERIEDLRGWLRDGRARSATALRSVGGADGVATSANRSTGESPSTRPPSTRLPSTRPLELPSRTSADPPPR